MVSLLDHNGIWPGQAGIDETGQGWLQDPPVGVELRVQPATASETLLIIPERPWERGALSPRVVLRDPVDGKLKLWYIASGEEEGSSSYIAYAESDDGYSWARPALGLVKWQGRDSNLCFDFGAFELQSVFLDPSAPPEARFKAMARDAIWHHKGEVLPSLSRERKWEIRNAMEAAGATNTARNGSRVWRRRVSCGQVPPEQQAEELYSEGVLRGATSPVSLSARLRPEVGKSTTPVCSGRQALDLLAAGVAAAERGADGARHDKHRGVRPGPAALRVSLPLPPKLCACDQPAGS